jgi:nicotinamidase-related amidase
VPIDITPFIDPTHTAVLLNECQQGVMGEQSVLPAMAEATRWILPNVARLVQGARANDVAVLHGVVRPRPDGRGGRNGRIVSRHTSGPKLDPETYSAVMPEIGVADSDFVVPRIGGMGGLSGSGALSILRSLEIRTLILGGISLNAGVLSMLFSGLDEGFDIVVVSDACGGFPRSYGEEILQKSVRPFAPIVTVDDVIATWSRAYPR